MGLREQFVVESSDPAAPSFSELCARFGISRKTGYKWVKRFEAEGVQGLENMSRRPGTSPLETAAEMALEVVQLRRNRPRWGPKKLRAVLLRKHAAAEVPSERTIDRILKRAGEPRAQRCKRIHVVREQPVIEASASNDAWTVDFKGWWRTDDGGRVNPLTVRDAFSRYVLAIDVMESMTAELVRDVFIGLFRRYGVPRAIHCDNGSPFGCTSARGGLSRLSAWWVSIGIRVVFSRPAKPQDNGAHERMHLDMRFDLEDPSAPTLEIQEHACEKWRRDFNQERPHEALGQKVPADLYRRSPQRAPVAPRVALYPTSWKVRTVVNPGRISLNGGLMHISAALIGQVVGLEPLEGGKHRVWFHELDLGEVDPADSRRPRRVTPGWGAEATANAAAAYGR